MTDSSIPETFYRRACLDDFLDDNDKSTKKKNNKNYSHNDPNTVSKNQQEFGHKKKIKP
jgi:hypothetical protein